MNQSQLAARMTKLSLTDKPQVDSLVNQLATEAREGPRALIQTFSHQLSGIGPEYAMLLAPQLQELAILPLLEVPVGKPTPQLYGWVLRAIADAEVAFKHRIVEKLSPLLDDTSSLPQPVLPDSEAQPYSRRVCDEVYLALRRIVKTDDDDRTATLTADTFLSSHPAFRSTEIEKFKKTKSFSNLLKGD